MKSSRSRSFSDHRHRDYGRRRSRSRSYDRERDYCYKRHHRGESCRAFSPHSQDLDRNPRGASSRDETPISDTEGRQKSTSVDEVSPGGEALESRDKDDNP